MMNKENFLNTKWDARHWSEDEKRAWQERVMGCGFTWQDGCTRVSELNADFYFIEKHTGLSFNNDLDFFERSLFDECKYAFAFPETLIEQGQKHDIDKPRYDLLPPIAIDEMAKVMTFGAKKYEPDNWRHVDNAVERYRAALLRHSFAMLRGEKLDPETGLPHAAHAMCCAAFLVELDSD